MDAVEKVPKNYNVFRYKISNTNVPFEERDIHTHTHTHTEREREREREETYKCLQLAPFCSFNRFTLTPSQVILQVIHQPFLLPSLSLSFSFSLESLTLPSCSLTHITSTQVNSSFDFGTFLGFGPFTHFICFSVYVYFTLVLVFQMFEWLSFSLFDHWSNWTK